MKIYDFVVSCHYHYLCSSFLSLENKKRSYTTVVVVLNLLLHVIHVYVILYVFADCR